LILSKYNFSLPLPIYETKTFFTVGFSQCGFRGSQEETVSTQLGSNNWVVMALKDPGMAYVQLPLHTPPSLLFSSHVEHPLPPPLPSGFPPLMALTLLLIDLLFKFQEITSFVQQRWETVLAKWRIHYRSWEPLSA
jgi:hypothetical protein